MVAVLIHSFTFNSTKSIQVNYVPHFAPSRTSTAKIKWKFHQLKIILSAELKMYATVKLTSQSVPRTSESDVKT